MKKNVNKKHDEENSKSFDPSKFAEQKELTNSAIQSFLVEKLKEKVNRKKDLDALVHTIQEFLNCFIVLGYNFEGEPVNFISAHNQQEADSLATLVNKLFIHNNLNNRDNS